MEGDEGRGSTREEMMVRKGNVREKRKRGEMREEKREGK